MTCKETILAEIKRLRSTYAPITSTEGKYRVEAYDELINFIDLITE